MNMDAEEPKYGEPRKYDPKFKGPIKERGCTDICCCIIFILAIVSYIAVGILAWSQGDPRKVIYPTDTKGQFCGQIGTTQADKPFLFYFNILKCASPVVLLAFQCPTTQMCVEACPNRSMTLMSAHRTGDWGYYKTFCKEDTVGLTATQILTKKLCPAVIIASKPFTSRCFPVLGDTQGVVTVGNSTVFDDGDGNIRKASELIPAVKNATVIIEARMVVMKIFEDFSHSWHWIIIALVIATILSLIFIVLLRFLAGIMVWVMIALAIIVIGYGIIHCSVKYANLKETPGSDVTLKELGFQMDLSVYLHIRQTWLAFAIILAIVEFIIVLILIFLRKRICIAVALIKEASRAIGHVMFSLLYPLLTFFLLAIVIAYWVITSLFLSTSNEPVYKVFSQDKDCSYANQTCVPENFSTSETKKLCPNSECLFAYYGGETAYHKYLIFLQFYNLFLFFWCANFITALGQMTLAGAFASYYWASDRANDMPACPVFASLGRALRYHTGSLAFGSLILSIVQIIRVLLEYLDHKLQGAQNKFAKFLLCCLKCCFWCLEKFIKFLNRNAYIMVAIYGKNFCASARDAFFLLMRNVIRVAVLDKVTDFLLFLGKLLIVGLVGVISFFFFSGRTKGLDVVPTLNYYWVPILTVVVGSYFIAHGFFSVYAMCVDTLFLCFCEDLERNDGSAERPYFMSPTLREILSKSTEGPDTHSPSSPPPEEVPLKTPTDSRDGE